MVFGFVNVTPIEGVTFYLLMDEFELLLSVFETAIPFPLPPECIYSAVGEGPGKLFSSSGVIISFDEVDCSLILCNDVEFLI